MAIKNLTEKIFPIGSLRRTTVQFFIVFPQLIKQYSLGSIIFYFKRYGIKGFLQKLAAKVGGSSLNLNTDRLYKLWIEKTPAQLFVHVKNAGEDGEALIQN